jgi:hypothetical protein
MGDDEPSTDNVQTGFLALNAMLNEWSTRRYGIYTVTHEEFTLTIDDGEYSIGSGGDFDTPRPIKILDAFIRDADTTDYDIEIIDREWYNDRPRKTTAGIPFYLYYEPSFPLGKVFIYFVPDKAYTLVIDSQKALAQYTNTANSLNLPPEYETALKFNFAIDWANELGVDPSNLVVTRAAETLRNLKALHSVPIPKVDTRPFDNSRNVLRNIYGDGR